MIRRICVLTVMATLVGLTATRVLHDEAEKFASSTSGIIASAGARCHSGGSGLAAHPDNRCTPGAYARLSRAQACKHRDRPDLPERWRERILRNYGVPNWSGENGEIDHRVPFFLGGRTTPTNLWPERGSIPNLKDKLEVTARNSIYHQVCESKTMTPQQGREVFMGDWRRAYRKYVG
jgi:hypothetical protein